MLIGWHTIVFAGRALGLAVLASAVLAELILRLLPVQSGVRAMPVDDRNPVARFTPNRTFVFSQGWRLSRVNRGRVNNVGFVNPQDYDSTLRTPLLAVVGDDFVQALMVPYDSTLQGRLEKALAGRARVYSFAGSGAALAQYLAWADYARSTFQPTGMVVVVTSNDADESLLKYWQDQGYYHFREGPDGELVLARVDYRPSRLRQLVRESSLARYLLMNGPRLFPGWVGAVSGKAPSNPDPVRLRDNERAVDAFLEQLPDRAGLPPHRIALVVNTQRSVLVTSPGRDAAVSKGAGVRQYLVDRGRRAGFEVLDMEPMVVASLAADGVRSEDLTDVRWSEIGHRLAAEAVTGSLVLRQLQTTAEGVSIRGGR